MSGQAWDTDKVSKAKLQSLQALSPNKTCADCAAPSPQWASPKFGTFICLTCAGLHRGLGVHISFVRSIAMDAFKPAEAARMEKGGNARWIKFYEDNQGGEKWDMPGTGADQAAKAKLERIYGGPIGDEYKERLACEVEEREYTGVPVVAKRNVPADGAGALMGGQGSASQKEQNEAYFARMGQANSSRPAGVRPSEGGKFEGFGSSPAPRIGGSNTTDATLPGVDDFQKDPMAALTKGFGWFTGQVGKSAKSVNEGWIQPAAQKIAEADLATQARQTAATASRAIQSGTKGAAERFNGLVDQQGGSGSRSGAAPERQDFWDAFGKPSDGAVDGPKKASTIGTSAVRKGKDDGWNSNW